jgi:Protein phosphatase 2C
VVLDGATHFGGVDTGCIHDVPWLVGHLAAALAEQLILGAANLPETLFSAIEITCSAHAGTCDLANPDSPSSTVAMVRSAGTAIEYLVLGDSPVILTTTDGGFWVASTNPDAAHEAITGIADGVTHVTLLTDGVTRLVEYYGYSWTDIFELLGKEGPSGLIQRVREAEQASPPPAYGYGKQHDDATAVYIQVI